MVKSIHYSSNTVVISLTKKHMYPDLPCLGLAGNEGFTNKFWRFSKGKRMSMRQGLEYTMYSRIRLYPVFGQSLEPRIRS